MAGYQISWVPLEIAASESTPKELYVYGDNVYYGGFPDVNEDNYEGILVHGDKIQVTFPQWYVTSPDVGGHIVGTARIEAIDLPLCSKCKGPVLDS